MPGLLDNIEVVEVATPLTLERFTLNQRGTFFGWHNTPDQSVLKRLDQVTPIENLLLAGAWTRPGGGQSAVMFSGRKAAKMILETEASPPQ